jgi:hypothetical protein
MASPHGEAKLGFTGYLLDCALSAQQRFNRSRFRDRRRRVVGAAIHYMHFQCGAVMALS